MERQVYLSDKTRKEHSFSWGLKTLFSDAEKVPPLQIWDKCYVARVSRASQYCMFLQRS